MSQEIIRDRVPAQELMAPDPLACPGCGGSLAMRLVLKALGPRTIVASPACCRATGSASQPRSALGVPLLHTTPASAAAAASGIRAALDVQGNRDTTVLAWASGWGGFEAALPALSGAAERNEDILFVGCDSDACLSTLGPPSSPPAAGPRTAGAPPGTSWPHPGKDLIGILAAHHIPYAATSTVAHPVDIIEKASKARAIRGTRFLHILAPCPPGWEVAEETMVEMARQAVRCRFFPLHEVENGRRWRLTVEHRGDPVESYLRRQGRFRHLTTEQIRHIQAEVDARWAVLERRVEHGT